MNFQRGSSGRPANSGLSDTNRAMAPMLPDDHAHKSLGPYEEGALGRSRSPTCPRGARHCSNFRRTREPMALCIRYRSGSWTGRTGDSRAGCLNLSSTQIPMCVRTLIAAQVSRRFWAHRHIVIATLASLCNPIALLQSPISVPPSQCS